MISTAGAGAATSSSATASATAFGSHSSSDWHESMAACSSQSASSNSWQLEGVEPSLSTHSPKSLHETQPRGRGSCGRESARALLPRGGRRDLLLEQARAARRLAGRELLDPHVRRLLLLGTKGRRRGAQLRRRLLNGGGAEDEFELLVLGRVAPNLYRGAERLNRLGKRLAAAALVVQLALLKESQLHLHQPGGARVAGRDRLLNPCLRLLALGDAEALGRERDLLRSR
mmetsp:Transcript_6220/g.17753  ORF Transcript_6220/g.17753 Transcript_6220/m.17753 type:complete len:230 (-) Transcript_6220:173-862(-)